MEVKVFPQCALMTCLPPPLFMCKIIKSGRLAGIFWKVHNEVTRSRAGLFIPPPLKGTNKSALGIQPRF